MSGDPIPMLLWCPSCSERHIDVGDFATKVHHTHACQGCGMVWRPALVPTVGVQFLPGFKNEERRRLPVLGDPGVRDPDAQCSEFEPGTPDGLCDTDGHYMCHECKHAQLCDGCSQIRERCECPPDDPSWTTQPADPSTEAPA